MITSNPKIKNKKRDRYFYDKYKYSITFLIPFSTTLRGCTNPNWHEIHLENRVRKRFELHKNSNRFFKGFAWINKLKEANPDDLVFNLKKVYTLLNKVKSSKIVYYNDWITIFTNTLDCVPDATQLSANNIRISEAELSIPRGYVTCRHSQHKYRIYLRHTLPSKEEHNNMKQFINTYKDYIFQSRVFSEWIQDDWNRYRPAEYYFFFETDEPGLSDMLDISVPGLRSRVCKIISDKYNTEGKNMSTETI